jgi:hypothetical protein
MTAAMPVRGIEFLARLAGGRDRRRRWRRRARAIRGRSAARAVAAHARIAAAAPGLLPVATLRMLALPRAAGEESPRR